MVEPSENRKFAVVITAMLAYVFLLVLRPVPPLEIRIGWRRHCSP
jgi:hypothetical protein